MDSTVELLVVQAINGMGSTERFSLVERVVRECAGPELDGSIGAAVGVGMSGHDLVSLMQFLKGGRPVELAAALDGAGIAHNLSHPIVTGLAFKPATKPKRKCWVRVIDAIDDSKIGGYAITGPWLHSNLAASLAGKLAVAKGGSNRYALLKVTPGETITIDLGDGSDWTFKDVQMLSPWGSWSDFLTHYKSQTGGP
jgi:hypothetical protein